MEADKPLEPRPERPRRRTSLKKLVEHMAKAVVDDPTSVVVEEVESSGSTSFKLNVAPDDVGRVIGKRGRIANAMRTVLWAAAGIEGRRVNLNIESAAPRKGKM